MLTLTNANYRVASFVTAIFICTLFLVACGEKPQTTASSAIVSTVNAPATTTATALTTSVVSLPSPTPQPVPNKLIIGDENDPLGSIYLYQPTNVDKLEEISLNNDVQKELKIWVTAAPVLAPLVAGVSIQPNTYVLDLKPELRNYKLMNSVDGGVRGIVVDSKNVIRGHASLKPVTLNPTLLIFSLGAAILLGEYLPGINNQLESLGQKVDQIKNMLDDKEQSRLSGNMQYLNSLAATLNKKNLDPKDIESFRDQLESVERESAQTIDFIQLQMNRNSDSLKNFKIEKSFVLFQNTKQLEDLEKLIGQYNGHSINYLNAVGVKGLSSQIRCVMPESRSLALDRLQKTRQYLNTWKGSQDTFYTEVEKKIPEMGGFLADSQKQDAFKDLVAKGKANAQQEYARVDGIFADTITKVNAEIASESLPFRFTIQLDNNGQIVKVNRIVNP